MANIAINGFGRIGRMLLRACLENHLNVVCINDAFLTPDYMEYLFKFDSTHGRFSGIVRIEDQNLYIDGLEMAISREKDPNNMPWGPYHVDVVLECTGVFTTLEKASLHLNSGAKFVIVAAPSCDIPMFVMGVNHTCYDTSQKVVSMACSTTHCLALLAKVIHDNFRIIEGLMLTVHALTPTQKVVDSPGCGPKRESRGAFQNIIPTCNGAAVAIGRIMPELDGKLTGMAMKVPVANVSVLDLTVRLGVEASYDEIKKAIQTACEKDLKLYMDYTEEDVVSSDFIGNPKSCIVDIKSGIPLNKQFVKLIAWFDNECAYAKRVVDFIHFVTFMDYNQI